MDAKEFLGKLEGSNKMPTAPAVVVKLLEQTRDPEVSVRSMADTIAMDATLSAKILRFANSPMSGLAREVTSLQHAVALMGVRGVKMTALSFAVLSVGEKTCCRGFDSTRFNIESLACGTAARVLAGVARWTNVQEAFLAGLLSQIGRSILASAEPQQYASIIQQATHVPLDLPDIERSTFGVCYAEVGAHTLAKWGIPPAICNAVESFRDLTEAPETSDLARLVHVGELAASLVCSDCEQDLPEAGLYLKRMNEWFDVPEERAVSVLGDIAREVNDTRTLLQVPERALRAPGDIEIEVRERIAELSLAMHLENQTMASQQEDLMRRATTDVLTGIGNRAAFDARLALELERTARSGESFALLMIDVDRFKSFNDTYGHLAGDRVLQSVARILDDNIRKVDFAARYGGEEFAVIAPLTDAEATLIFADRLRQSIERLSIGWEGKALQVTASIGAAVSTQVVDPRDATTIIEAADRQLYTAKAAGRNCVRISVNGMPVDAEVAAHDAL